MVPLAVQHRESLVAVPDPGAAAGEPRGHTGPDGNSPELSTGPGGSTSQTEPSDHARFSKWGDGIPPACIDENLDMVKFLVEYGANVNQQDNEGWTPLHAVASCGYLNIAEYLISRGANVAAVNSEGEVPSDLAEEEAMKDLLLEQVKKQGTDLDQARKGEEQQMLQDARQWLNRRKIEDRKHPRTGATALHVAAAKGYSEVMRLLIQAEFGVNVQDSDGWTPLHAAAHWGVKEACSILAEALCDMDIRNKLVSEPQTKYNNPQSNEERRLPCFIVLWQCGS
ncbi:UNVERIFIED_CONTAM: hypothetical protein K2H54_061701 [Gekko kuhli]